MTRTAEQLLDTVWRVGGAGLTDDLDCHCYLIRDDDGGGILVDTGTGLAAGAWLAAVAEICDPSRLTGVVVTHYHADHAGGAAAAHAAGLPVFGSPETVAALAIADEVRTSLRVARVAGIYPSDYRLAPAPVRPIAGRLMAGSLGLEIVAAPGHCDGHVVVLARTAGRTVLFSGDCLFAGGRVSLQALPDCRLDRYAETVIGLAGRDIDALFPGHGDAVLDNAGPDLDRAADSFRRLVPPPNFLRS